MKQKKKKISIYFSLKETFGSNLITSETTMEIKGPRPRVTAEAAAPPAAPAVRRSFISRIHFQAVAPAGGRRYCHWFPVSRRLLIREDQGNILK